MPAEGSRRPPLDLVLWPLAKLALHLATLRGYGIFRDELYYLACSRRLDFGYVDHPPLSLLLLRLQTLLVGDSLPALRLLPALAGAAAVLLVGLIARRLGGGPYARTLAMSGALAAPAYLGTHHYYSMNAFDLLAWAAAGWLVLRIADEGEERPRLWLALGVVLGLGLENKISVLWLGLGLAVGLLLTPQRRWLATRWPWLAAALAVALFLPHVLWQIAHDWPTREFVAHATGEKMLAVEPLDFVLAQVRTMHRWLWPLWAAGLVHLLRRPKLRILGLAYLTVFALLAISGTSRPGYLAPAYAWLLGAGGVAFEAFFAARGWPRLRWAAPVLVLLAGAVRAPLALPLLPVERYIAYARALGVAPSTSEKKELALLPQQFADMHGWESIVATVERAWASLAPEERSRAALFASNYGEAGAVEQLATDPELRDSVLSGHNNYWIWGPRGHTGEVVLVLNAEEAEVRAFFEQFELAGTTDCGHCMPYENRAQVWIGRRPRRSLAEAWPALKHYD